MQESFGKTHAETTSGTGRALDSERRLNPRLNRES